ncbi:MAG: hypothetical protein LBD24_06785 [Spirochaetaceae bacterium]|nr:hypothetical protein [Spirochaetaceae bacterium]
MEKGCVATLAGHENPAPAKTETMMRRGNYVWSVKKATQGTVKQSAGGITEIYL